MTREQALDELLAVEMELIRLAEKRNNLRKIVLMTEYSPQKPPQIQQGVTKSVRPGSVSEATLKVLKEHGGPMTVTEVAILMDSKKNAVNLTLDRLREKGFVYAERLNGTNKWSLAIHDETT